MHMSISRLVDSVELVSNQGAFVKLAQVGKVPAGEECAGVLTHFSFISWLYFRRGG